MEDGFSAARSRSASEDLHTSEDLHASCCFVGGDFVFLLEGESDVVEAVDEAVTAEVVDLEIDFEAVIVGNGASFEIDGELVAFVVGGPSEEVVDGCLVEDDGEHAVFEAIVEEDVGEARCEDDAEAVLFECPGCVFAAGATAEVAACDQDAGPFVARQVQFELRIVGTVVEVPPIEEEEFAEAGALDPLEKLLGDNLVGIDVGPIHQGNESGMCCESTHGSLKVQVSMIKQN